MIIEHTTFRNIVERIICNDRVCIVDGLRDKIEDIRNSLVCVLSAQIIQLPVSLILETPDDGQVTSTVDN
jgi:hypothetical protein